MPQSPEKSYSRPDFDPAACQQLPVQRIAGIHPQSDALLSGSMVVTDVNRFAQLSVLENRILDNLWFQREVPHGIVPRERFYSEFVRGDAKSRITPMLGALLRPDIQDVALVDTNVYLLPYDAERVACYEHYLTRVHAGRTLFIKGSLSAWRIAIPFEQEVTLSVRAGGKFDRNMGPQASWRSAVALLKT